MSWNRQSWLVYPGLTLDFGHLIIGDISLPKFLTDICSCCAWRTRLWDDQHWLLTACSWANGILSHLPLRGHPRMQNKMQKRQPFTRYLEMAQSISFGLALIPPTSQHIFHTLNGVPHLPAHSEPTQSSRIAIHSDLSFFERVQYCQLCPRVYCLITSLILLRCGCVMCSGVSPAPAGASEKTRHTSLIPPQHLARWCIKHVVLWPLARLLLNWIERRNSTQGPSFEKKKKSFRIQESL